MSDDVPLAFDTRRIFGVEVLSCDCDQACDLIAARISRRIPTRVAFLNANLSLLSIEQPGLRDALAGFVVFNDGVGVEIANRFLNGSGFAANLNGTDLIPLLLTRIRQPLRIFLVAGRPGTMDRILAEFGRRWPRHEVVGHAYGLFTSEPEVRLRQRISKAAPDVVLVATGNPKQELWIAENVPSCAPCAFGVGALFDFIIGETKRAPHWVRAVRMEWLYRLVGDPRRLWRRYLVGNAKYLLHVVAVWLVMTYPQLGAWVGAGGDLAAAPPGRQARRRRGAEASADTLVRIAETAPLVPAADGAGRPFGASLKMPAKQPPV